MVDMKLLPQIEAVRTEGGGWNLIFTSENGKENWIHLDPFAKHLIIRQNPMTLAWEYVEADESNRRTGD